MPRTMLEYTKTVLQKVSFDSSLFCKELEKALTRLLPIEVEELKLWLRSYIFDKPELKQSIIYL
ncbi:hypothetical protein [Arenibacter certesii]|nr:hypothetical protein [Arenibacter certesii]